MLAAAAGALVASSGLMAGVARPAVQVRAQGPQMYDLSAFDDIWGFDAKKACYDAWDPSKPRDYDNFNPFERNDEGAMCDTNGCFPGQSKGYKSPTRPDVSYGEMQKEKDEVEAIMSSPKGSSKGQPGNWQRKWQDNLGAPP